MEEEIYTYSAVSSGLLAGKFHIPANRGEIMFIIEKTNVVM
jgi:hypothetical protein